MSENPLRERKKIVTIDGPSGVGKSTISRMLAQSLGFTYLDTGAMYRAVAVYCHGRGIEVSKESDIIPVLQDIELELLPPDSEDGDVRVLLMGEDISDRLRTPEISMLASAVSAHRSVREKLTHLQQAIGEKGEIVAEGRDTGTVVFPDAMWKFFLDASPEERCRRRVNQLRLRGEDHDANLILEQIIKRDRNDRQRSIAPLQPARDAVIIDSTTLSIEIVVKTMLENIASR